MERSPAAQGGAAAAAVVSESWPSSGQPSARLRLGAGGPAEAFAGDARERAER